MKPKSQSADDPITRAFIGHAMKVHSSVGPGLDEEIYHQELVAALTAAGISHLSKPRRDLVYRGIVFHFGKTTADFSFVQHPKKKHPADSGRPTDYL
ncbi:MAG: GxxExxY protein [Verrucomicrobia bacterium]|nr:GxxExxY protein [Verrucomicrobiota bacterium]